MTIVRAMLWFLCAFVLLAFGMYVASNSPIADYFTSAFIEWQPYLPIEMSFDQFLVAVAIVSIIIVVIVLGISSMLVLGMGARLSVIQQRQIAQGAAADRQLTAVTDHHLQQFEQLCSSGQVLTKRLDKRVLVQGIVDAASKATGSRQTNSAVSLWLLAFGSDTMNFEVGRYCDESFFTQREFPLTEQPFARVIGKRAPLLMPTWEHDIKILRPEKVRRMGSATGLLVVPLVVENSVLGVLFILCHPDVLTSYEEQEAFYNAFWVELALALAIAIQGEMAIIDRLTGTHNREYFMRRLIQEVDRANRYQFPLSLLMIDIDDFKPVNDTLGHPQGDAVLRIISHLLKQEVRAIDLIGRYGGEEFIVLLPETGLGSDITRGGTGALMVAERIRKAVDDEFAGMLKPLSLSVSIGLTVRKFPEDRGMNHKELIRLADEQLYKAKASGKNRVCYNAPEATQEVS